MSDKYVTLGKFISLILRHKPQVAGLTLDEHGWANVDELLAGVNKKHPMTMADLEYVVANNNKKRFSFNEDKTKIRANQGHSINVDVELEEAEPPAVLYHGTGEKHVASILEQGLKPMTLLYVHLSKDIETAKNVGSRHGKPVIFTVDCAAMRRDGYVFYLSKNGVWLTKSVPSHYIHL